MSTSSSNRRSFNALWAVMASIAFRYLTANTSISYVEFQRVTTSRGMSLDLRLRSTHACRQAGSAMVVEWMIAKASCRTYVYEYNEGLDGDTIHTLDTMARTPTVCSMSSRSEE